jgi:hypothetical protein
MNSETVGNFQIEYSARQLPGSGAWGAWVTVYGPSSNPMHRNPIFPARRVAPGCQYPDKDAAQAEAKKFAHSLVDKDEKYSVNKRMRQEYVPL